MHMLKKVTQALYIALLMLPFTFLMNIFPITEKCMFIHMSVKVEFNL